MSIKYCDKIIKDINKNLSKYGSRSKKINETFDENDQKEFLKVLKNLLHQKLFQKI